MTFNKADKTLIAAAILFVLAFIFHLQHPHSLVGEAVLAMTEAALVGGAADWFAVTALFEKPLGWPWHTAILPRRRQSFIESTTKMIRQEFFSRKKIIRYLENIKLLPIAIDWLSKQAVRKRIIGALTNYMRNMFQCQDDNQVAAEVTAKIAGAIKNTPASGIVTNIGAWIKNTGEDKRILRQLAAALSAKVATPEARQTMVAMFEKYEQERTKDDALAILLGALASATNLVNYDEAAGLVQRHLQKFLDELAAGDSPFEAEILGVIWEKAAAVDMPDFISCVEELKNDFLTAEAGDKYIVTVLEDLRRQMGTSGETFKIWEEALNDIAVQEYDRFLPILAESNRLTSVEKLLHDVVARCALQGQLLINDIVRDVLGNMSDKELSALVYDKVEPDLLWIRMNGSIVGAIAGLGLFCLLRFL